MQALQTALVSNTFVSLKVLEALMKKDLTDDEKAKIIAEGFAELEARYPDLKNTATKTELSETELRLTKEIESVRKEIKELDLKLTKEIEGIKKEIEGIKKETEGIKKETEDIKKDIVGIKKDIKELDLRLTKEIKDSEIRFTKAISETKSSLIKWSFLFWISQMGALIGIGFFVYKALGIE